MRHILHFSTGLCLLFLCGCVSPPRSEFIPPTGALFTSYTAPLLIENNQTIVGGDRSGSVSAHYVYEPIVTGISASLGDCSIKGAARRGRLGRVGVADYKFLSILGIYEKTTVHVYEAPQPKPKN